MRSTRVVLIMLGVLLGWGGLVQASHIDLYQDTTINVGDIYDQTICVHDSVTVTVLGGSVTEMSLGANAIANIYDGQMQVLAVGIGKANIWGGNFGTISGNTQNAINFYGYNFVFTPNSAIEQNSGTLTGFWADGTPFSLHLRYSAPATGITVLHEIPEPATLSLLLIGLLAVKKPTK